MYVEKLCFHDSACIDRRSSRTSNHISSTTRWRETTISGVHYKQYTRNNLNITNAVLLYLCLQTGVEWSEDTPYASVDRDIGQMIANMNGGKLKGTMVINKEDRKVILNI